MKRTLLVGTLTAMAIAQSACNRDHADNTPAKSEMAPTAPPPHSAPTVELNQAQLGAIKIEPVATYSFFHELEAAATVGFDEDTAVIQAESTLIGAAATFDLTRKELLRVQALGEANGIAQKELEQALAEHQTAAGALKAARDALRALGKTDRQVDRIIGSGRFDRPINHGSEKWLVANVSESDSPLVQIGQAVSAKVMARPGRVYLGRLLRISATIDPQTHRMTARAQVLDPKDELRPGMLADVAIRVGGPVDSIAAPATAVMREGDGMMVAWVTSDRHQFVQRPLKLGLQRDSRYQVLEGLRQGELLVVDGGVFLSNLLEAPPSD